jgi:hypothetical protein
MEYYYALTLTANGASTSAYYSLTPTSNLSITQGGATLAPSSATQQMITVSIYPQTLQINAPAGYVSAGVNILTGESRVSGQVVVSPPVNVATVVTLYGNGGQQIGQYIVDPGVEGGVFSFPVTAQEGIPAAGDAASVVDKLLKK